MRKTIYQLTIGDLQEVAKHELGRELSAKEIGKLIDPIAEKIPWYEAIADAINETLTIDDVDE
jgi:hypothetical protein